MNCREFEKEYKNWLGKAFEENLSAESVYPEVPADLADHAETCDQCRSRLGTALALFGIPTPSPDSISALESRIISRLDEQKFSGKSIRRIIYPAAAAAAVILFAFLFLLPGSVRDRREGEVVIRFYLEAPSASQVALVGDWNDWDAEADFLRDAEGDGIWEAEIRLIPGREYRYQFFIDGKEWIADPGAPLTVDDGFGGKNSVLQL